MKSQFKLDSNELKKILKALISEGVISVNFGDYHPNPHIRALSDSPKDEQVSKLKITLLKNACIYPTAASLSNAVNKLSFEGKPYELELALGAPQLEFRAFDLSVLEHYRNDPRYEYQNDDIRGSISIKDEYYQSEAILDRDQILLETFGFCYDENLNRAVAVFLRYLAGLSPEHQRIWKAKELNGKYRLHPEYYSNSILGNWGETISIFDAFIEELKCINQMAMIMDRALLFKNTFEENKPREFGFLVRPTLNEYNHFVHTLDKMLSDNIDKKFFKNEIADEVDEPRRDGKIVVRQKGTIKMLEDWIGKYFHPADRKPVDQMFEVFKDIRKQRQVPAHTIGKNIFDQKFFHNQRELIIKTYDAIRTLRLILSNHPRVREANIEINSFIQEGKISTY